MNGILVHLWVLTPALNWLVPIYTHGKVRRVQHLDQEQYIAVSWPWLEHGLLNLEFSTSITGPPCLLKTFFENYIDLYNT